MLTEECICRVKAGLQRQKLYTALECIESLEKENEELKQQVSYLKDNLRVARKDREVLQDAIANGLENVIKEQPFTTLRFLADKKVKEDYEQKIVAINKGWNEIVNGWVVDYKELEKENNQLANEHNSLVIEHERLDYLYGQQIDEINNLFKENERLKAQNEKMRCCENCKHFEAYAYLCNRYYACGLSECKDLSNWEMFE